MSSRECIQGQYLKIQGPHEAIPFPTLSDCMFASLVVKYDTVPIALFDDILSLSRDPNFRPTEMSLSRTEDVLEHIATQRACSIKRRGISRATGKESHCDCDQVPLLVVELVAEYFNSEVIPFHRAPATRTAACEATTVLSTMAVVHRSWTAIAQYYTRRRIYIRGPRNMRSILQSSLLGPWVRELSISRHVENFLHTNTPYDPTDVSRFICIILEKCVNVKNLFIQDTQVTSPKRGDLNLVYQPSHDILGHLEKLTSLQNLWLTQLFEPPATDLWRLLSILPQFHFLKSLNLHGWGPGANTSAGPQSIRCLESGPNAALESVGLFQVAGGSDLFTQLLGPRDGYVLKRLGFSLHDIYRNSTFNNGQPSRDIRPSLAQVQPHITSLMISDCEKHDDIASIVANFPVLQRLCLCVYFVIPTITLTTLQSLQYLKIHFIIGPIDGIDGESNASMIEALDRLPNLKELVLQYNLPTQGGVVVEPELLQTLQPTYQYCERKSIAVKVTHIERAPSLLDV